MQSLSSDIQNSYKWQMVEQCWDRLHYSGTGNTKQCLQLIHCFYSQSNSSTNIEVRNSKTSSIQSEFHMKNICCWTKVGITRNCSCGNHVAQPLCNTITIAWKKTFFINNTLDSEKNSMPLWCVVTLNLISPHTWSKSTSNAHSTAVV